MTRMIDHCGWRKSSSKHAQGPIWRRVELPCKSEKSTLRGKLSKRRAAKDRIPAERLVRPLPVEHNLDAVRRGQSKNIRLRMNTCGTERLVVRPGELLEIFQHMIELGRHRVQLDLRPLGHCQRIAPLVVTRRIRESRENKLGRRRLA